MSDGAAIVLQARMGSTRLPGKSLAPIAGRSLLARAVERLRARSGLPVVLATTTLPADDLLAEEARAAGHRRGARTGRRRAGPLRRRGVGARTSTSSSARPPTIPRWTSTRRGARSRCCSARPPTTSSTTGCRSAPRWRRCRVAALRRAAGLASTAYDREHVTPFIRRDAAVAEPRSRWRRCRCGAPTCASPSTPPTTSPPCGGSTPNWDRRPNRRPSISSFSPRTACTRVPRPAAQESMPDDPTVPPRPGRGVPLQRPVHGRPGRAGPGARGRPPRARCSSRRRRWSCSAARWSRSRSAFRRRCSVAPGGRCGSPSAPGRNRKSRCSREWANTPPAPARVARCRSSPMST